MDYQILKKKLYVKSHRMGMKELDLVMSFVADNYLDKMSKKELMQFEKLLLVEDSLLYSWIIGDKVVSKSYNNSVWLMVKNYN